MPAEDDVERKASKGRKENRLDLMLCELRGLCVPGSLVQFHEARLSPRVAGPDHREFAGHSPTLRRASLKQIQTADAGEQNER
jgi:hypothetical protein